MVSINGHRLLFLARERHALTGSLGIVGADRIKRIRVKNSRQAQEVALDDLARKVDGGVVVVPHEHVFLDILRKLQSQLPWIH